MESATAWRFPMIRQLRRKLALLYTVTTGAILTAVVIALLAFNVKAARKDEYQRFQNEILAISSRMQFGSTLSGSWLASTEAAGRLIIHIEENETPLLFSGAWKPATDRKLLIERAKEQARLEHVSTVTRPVSSSVIRSSVFTVRGDQKDTYYGSVIVMSTTKGFQSLTLLGYSVPPSAVIKKQGPLFLIFDLTGIAALLLVSWYFVGKSLRPVEESHRRQSEFIAAASHELRSPLAVIQSSTSALEAEPDKQAQYLKNIREECGRMAVLINDMLLLASTDSGKWSLALEDIDMDTLLIDAFELFEPVCRQKSVKLRLELPEDALPTIHGDSARLKQVLTILLDNAVSYTPAGKEVTLKAEVRGKQLVLSVEDEGCGISEEAKKHIFERFYRGEISRTDKKHFGLGLSIAKELIALHGGDISVEDGENGGSRFVICLIKN